MKKTIKLMSIGMIMAMCLISCDKDEGLTGWYAMNLPAKGSREAGGWAYHFINSNTVEYYPTISGSPRWEWKGENYSEALPSPMNGYYIQAGNVQHYTYEVIDNKVYIPMQGVILTISGNKLLPDGGGNYIKQ